MKKQFYVTGYVGEGAGQMLKDLQKVSSVRLIEKVIENRYMRFLFYRLNKITNDFKHFGFLKKLFYPWFSLSGIPYDKQKDNYILFFNSGFCKELDLTFLDYFRKRNKDVKLILYIVDPMVGFQSQEHMKVISRMDMVYCINRADCEHYGFHYYPLIYSKSDNNIADEKYETTFDLYYLGSGTDRDLQLRKIAEVCEEKKISTDFHVLNHSMREGKKNGITYHRKPLTYKENIGYLLQANCLLEIMHENFDNPTQRYAEAVAYSKKLLTNNENVVTFDFYNPDYVKIFHSAEEINVDFIKKQQKIEYGYDNEFSPCRFLEQIEQDLMKGV